MTHLFLTDEERDVVEDALRFYESALSRPHVPPYLNVNLQTRHRRLTMVEELIRRCWP